MYMNDKNVIVRIYCRCKQNKRTVVLLGPFIEGIPTFLIETS